MYSGVLPPGSLVVRHKQPLFILAFSLVTAGITLAAVGENEEPPAERPRGGFKAPPAS
jgi:hypothetical protein